MNEQEVRTQLAVAGLRVTYPRLALIAELARSHTQPRSAAELAATLSQFPRSSVYRNLEALETAGLIKSSMIKWVRQYELGDPLTPHHHHLSCTSCGIIVDFDSNKLERQLVVIASESQFELEAHSVELRGLCNNCRKSTPIQSQNMLSIGIKAIKRLKPSDPLMDKLKREDNYKTFDDAARDSEEASDT